MELQSVLARAMLLVGAGLAPAISAAAPDVDALLAKIARPAPATTPFVEVRYSKLLDQPLIVKGQLEYHEDGALVRAVDTPFRERTEIRGETVSIERVGKSPRRFSLKHAPELRSMLGGFAAVLGGGRAAIEQDFTLAVTGDDSVWQLALTPKSPTVGKYVKDIVIDGRAGDPACIVVTQPDEQGSVMLVGKAAGTRLPRAPQRNWFNTFCSDPKP